LDLVAEGIETIGQADLMRGMGVATAQGWLFEKAVPIDDFTELVLSGRSWREKLNSTGRPTASQLERR